MPYIDGLPPATTVNATDLLVVAQGGTAGVPGTATPKQAQVSQITSGITSATPITPTGGTTARTLAAWLSDVANVLAFGADPTGAKDSTAAIRLAVAAGKSVYLPTGNYIVTDAITLNPGHIMFGDGRVSSVLQVNSTSFTMSAHGVVVFPNASDTSAGLRDIGINFTQPQQALRANIVQFPPAIYAQNAPRFVIENVRISGGAYIGLDARGNSGGAFISSFEVCALYAGMWWDGSLDFVHISKYHFWPFGISGATLLETGVYMDGGTYAAIIGRVDGFNAVDFSSFMGAISILSNATNINFALLSLDSDHANLTIAGGNIAIASCYNSGMSAQTEPRISISGGRVALSALTVPSSGAPGAYFNVTGGATVVSAASIIKGAGGNIATVSGGDLTFSGDIFMTGGAGISVTGGKFRYECGVFNNTLYGVSSIVHTGGNLMLDGVEFSIPGTGTYTADIVSATSSSGTHAVVSIVGCAWTTNVSATGAHAVTITGDTRSILVMGNVFNGWPISATNASSTIGPNAA